MTSRFELIEQIGRGGMGVVWKARDTETGQVVALKQLHQQLTVDEEFVARFGREVEIATRIDSPNVVRVLGHGSSNGAPYLVMEYVDGGSLRDMIRERGPMPWSVVRDIGIQVAQGLAAVHAAGVIHRDVKPSNILFDARGTAKLADFGIARAGDMTRMTSSSAMLGTPAYMAPDLQEDERSDLYSLGCVLYEALSGAPPFEADTPHALLQHHLRVPPDLGRLPATARFAIGSMLEKDPANRPADSTAVATLLNRGLENGPVFAPERDRTPESSFSPRLSHDRALTDARTSWRRPTFLVVSAVCVVVAGSALLAAIMRVDRQATALDEAHTRSTAVAVTATAMSVSATSSASVAAISSAATAASDSATMESANSTRVALAVAATSTSVSFGATATVASATNVAATSVAVSAAATASAIAAIPVAPRISFLEVSSPTRNPDGTSEITFTLTIIDPNEDAIAVTWAWPGWTNSDTGAPAGSTSMLEKSKDSQVNGQPQRLSNRCSAGAVTDRARGTAVFYVTDAQELVSAEKSISFVC